MWREYKWRVKILCRMCERVLKEGRASIWNSRRKKGERNNGIQRSTRKRSSKIHRNNEKVKPNEGRSIVRSKETRGRSGRMPFRRKKRETWKTPKGKRSRRRKKEKRKTPKGKRNGVK